MEVPLTASGKVCKLCKKQSPNTCHLHDKNNFTTYFDTLPIDLLKEILYAIPDRDRMYIICSQSVKAKKICSDVNFQKKWKILHPYDRKFTKYLLNKPAKFENVRLYFQHDGFYRNRYNITHYYIIADRHTPTGIVKGERRFITNKEAKEIEKIFKIQGEPEPARKSRW